MKSLYLVGNKSSKTVYGIDTKGVSADYVDAFTNKKDAKKFFDADSAADEVIYKLVPVYQSKNGSKK